MRALIVAALVAVAATPPDAPGTLEARPATGELRVHVWKRGLFAAFAHDHDFEVTDWRATVALPADDPGRASVDVVAAAGSLHDREKGLSSGDRRKVDAQAAGPEGLDAARHATITYRSDGVTLDARAGDAGAPVHGTVHGRLTLRGETRPLDVAFEARREADGWRVQGRARLKQSDFGIKPFSGFGGTVSVKDEVEVTFTTTLRRPTTSGATARPRSG